VHRAERAGDVKNSLADIGKAETYINYKPQVRFKEGLDRTIDWFEANKSD